MQLIVLMPVRNEERILPATLGCLEQFCDQIIIADHHSIDGTREVASKFKKVMLVDNATPQEGPEGIWPALFDEARQFDGNNLLLCLDADEIPPPSIFKNIKSFVGEKYNPGDYFSLWWVQLWRSYLYYRNDQSVWSNSYKPLLVYDDRLPLSWSDRGLHSGRLPEHPNSALIKLEGFPILHLQWVYWDRTQFKQARYRILEFIQSGFSDAKAINAKYAITLGDEKELLAPVPQHWLEDINFPPDLMAIDPCWQKNDIILLFKKYGVSCFESLQIWHLPELSQYFITECGRLPMAAVDEKIGSSYNILLKRAAKRVLPSSAIEWLRTSVIRK